MDEKLLSARPFVSLRSCNERVHPLHSKCSFLSSLRRHFYKNHRFLTRHRRGWSVRQHQKFLKDVCSNKYTYEVNKWAGVCLYLYFIPQLFISALCLQILIKTALDGFDVSRLKRHMKSVWGQWTDSYLRSFPRNVSATQTKDWN